MLQLTKEEATAVFWLLSESSRTGLDEMETAEGGRSVLRSAVRACKGDVVEGYPLDGAWEVGRPADCKGPAWEGEDSALEMGYDRFEEALGHAFERSGCPPARRSGRGRPSMRSVFHKVLFSEWGC